MNQILHDMASASSVQHMTSQHLSDITGLDRKTVASVLSGENDNPKLETVCAIASALGGEITYSTVDSRAAVSSGSISYYRTMVASAHAETENKKRWIKVLFWTCVGLIGVIILQSLVALAIVANL